MGRISYSQLSMYNQCPYRWKLNYIDKLRVSESNIYLIFGIAFHEVLQLYLDTMFKKTIREANELDLPRILRDNMVREFENAKESDGKEPCTLEEIKEFYDDGIYIIDFFKKHRSEYFTNVGGWELIGCEIPVDLVLKNNLNWIGYLDVVLYHKPTNVIKIIDIKTSTMGWNKWQKQDFNKTSQLLLYKRFYSEMYDHPISDIEIEYFIVKRKLWENAKFPQKRVQKFVPANGTPSLNKVGNLLSEFVQGAFDDNGEKLDKEYEKKPSVKNCKWCEFKDLPDHCDRLLKK
jgi:hypothetical protein